MKLIDRLPEFVPRRSRRNPIRRPQQVAECLDVRLNLSVVAVGADVSCLDEQFEDGSNLVIGEVQPDVYLEEAVPDELFDDSFWMTDVLAGEDFYDPAGWSDPFADDVYYEWSDLSDEYLGDLAWSDDVYWEDEIYWADDFYWEGDIYWELAYDEETDELVWYAFDTTIDDVFDDGSYFADVTYFEDPLADDWFDLFADDSDSSLTQVANTSFSESTAAESDIAVDGQSSINSAAAVASGVPGATGLGSHFVTAMTHVRSPTAHVHAKAGIVDALSGRQHAGRKIPVASESTLAGRMHQPADLFSSAESIQDRHDVQRRRAQPDVDFDGAASERRELIGRLDQLFKEFTHANGVASEFDQIGLAVTYPGQRGSRLLELSSVSDRHTNDNGESARVLGAISRQSSSERLGSHEAVGVVVAAGLVGAAARSGWMLRRRRACDLRAAAVTGR